MVSCMKSSAETKNVKVIFLILGLPSLVCHLSDHWRYLEARVRDLGEWAKRGKLSWLRSAECLGVLLPPFSPCSCWASLCAQGCQFCPVGPPFLTCSHLLIPSPHSCPRGAAESHVVVQSPGFILHHCPLACESWKLADDGEV